MAAAFWHFLIGEKTMDALRGVPSAAGHSAAVLNCPPVFLAGIQGPDVNFYPGGHKAISMLAHGDRSADLGRNLLALAETDEERAYALGWLMHLATDVTTHPLVNRIIAERLARLFSGETEYASYPFDHHRIEWGVDVYLLREKTFSAQIPDISGALHSARHLQGFVFKGFFHTFGRRFPEAAWQNAIDSMISYLTLITRVWRLTGRLNADPRGMQSVKNLFYLIVAWPVFRLAAMHNPQAGVFIPAVPGNRHIAWVREHTEMACRVFLDYLADDFRRLVNGTG